MTRQLFSLDVPSAVSAGTSSIQPRQCVAEVVPSEQSILVP